MTPTLSVELDRSSPVPLYFQVSQVFEKAILDGKLKPGDRFENELALASRLNLSRPTTRRAIQELVDKGLLVRKRGVGTQVVQTPVHRPVELTSLYDDLARAGQEPATKVLEYTIGPASDEIAGWLNLSPGSEVAMMRRLRTSNGQPLALMTNYLPAALRARRGATRTIRPVPVTAFARRSHQAGSSADRGEGGQPGRGTAARREAEGPATRDGTDRVRRLRTHRGVRQSRVPRIALLLRHHPR